MRKILLLLILGLLIGTNQVIAQNPLSAVEHNDDWEPLVQEFDGVPMILVPPGCFIMGNELESDEAPVHEICFTEPFWLDQTEVTNAQFVEFGGEASTEPCSTDEDAYPRDCINWFEADAFCELRDARLPTEAEWEYAARGPDGLTYPWGDEFNGERLNFCDANCFFDWKDDRYDDGFVETSPVTDFPQGMSWVGAYDMAGNLWEWTSTVYKPYPYDEIYEIAEHEGDFRALRGGSYDDDDNFTRSNNRTGFNPAWSVEFHGFRCARDFSPEDLFEAET